MHVVFFICSALALQTPASGQNDDQRKNVLPAKEVLQKAETIKVFSIDPYHKNDPKAKICGICIAKINKSGAEAARDGACASGGA